MFAVKVFIGAIAHHHQQRSLFGRNKISGNYFHHFIILRVVVVGIAPLADAHLLGGQRLADLRALRHRDTLAVIVDGDRRFVTVRDGPDNVLRPPRGVTAEEVERAQNRLLAAAVYSQDSLASGPRFYGSALGIGGTVADVNAWPERIASVTKEAVTAAAAHVWRDDRLVTSLLTPAEGNR